MIDVRKLAVDAASQFGLSLKDDPTAWDDGDENRVLADMPAEIVAAHCRDAAKECAASAVNRALGAASEAIATAMDVALYEDGPLTDLAEVWARHVTGLTVDLDGVAEAEDWQGRVDALREAIRRAVPSVPSLAPAPTIGDVLAYLNSDPRFDGLGKLKKGVAALNEDGTPFVPPAFLTKGRPAEPEAVDWEDETGEHGNSIDGGPPAVTWDDEPTPAPAATVQRKRGRGSRAAAPSLVPGFPALLNGAGMTKADVARLCGYSESYVGYIFSGKKPWPGLKAEQVTALRDEVAARLDALTEALAVLDGGKLLLPAEA